VMLPLGWIVNAGVPRSRLESAPEILAVPFTSSLDPEKSCRSPCCLTYRLSSWAP
jgi:hypothetical protein